jgi:hypothetical protein
VVISHLFFAGLEDSTNRIIHFEKWKRRKLLEDLRAEYRTVSIKAYDYLIRAFTRFFGGKRPKNRHFWQKKHLLSLEGIKRRLF